MNKNRMETLKANGIDTGRYFTLVVNEDIKAGTKINISIEGNEVAEKIIEDGYVKNTRLHRRFVCAHYFRMLNSSLGWHGYLNSRYSYMYTIDMMLEEVRVLAHLEKVDKATFNERKQFFTLDVVRRVLGDYYKDVVKYTSSLPRKNCKGRPYVSINGVGNVFVSDLSMCIDMPIRAMIEACAISETYEAMYYHMKNLRKNMIKLPYDTKKSKTWVDAFQKEGAYYTLKNLVLFHDVSLYYDREFYDAGDSSMVALREIVKDYEGYQMNALLKKTIEMNNFDFARSIAEHK